MTTNDALRQGALNLLTNCAGLRAGMRVAVVREDPRFGWYDAKAPAVVAGVARELGAEVSLVPVGAPANEPNPATIAAVDEHDCTVFFSRIGDQARFEAAPPGKTVVMSYARTAEALASPYGRADHRAFLAMKAAVNDALFGAEAIRITCPRGTDLSGAVPLSDLDEARDVGVRRFPMGVHQPLDAGHFAGRVVLADFLTPTGSKVYEPASLALDRTVAVTLAGGRWGDPEGDPETVAEVEVHYRRVAETFGLDPYGVDSWHAGFHPSSFFAEPAAADPDRWSNTIFTSPRFLHFHTCGDGPPGEVCWMIHEPTVIVDGAALWERGRFRPERAAPTRACLAEWPDLAPLYRQPEQRDGL